MGWYALAVKEYSHLKWNAIDIKKGLIYSYISKSIKSKNKGKKWDKIYLRILNIWVRSPRDGKK